MKVILFLFLIILNSQFLYSKDLTTIKINSLNTFSFPEISFFSTISVQSETVYGLKKKDFRLKEDANVIKEFSIVIKGEPVNVGLVVDTSGSVKDFLNDIKKGARAFISEMKNSDKAVIVEFSGCVVIGQKLTFDKSRLTRAINDLSARGGTKLYDGIYRGLQELSGRNKYIVVFTDGRDVRYKNDKKQFSDHTVDEIIKKANIEHIAIYCIGIGKEVDREILTEISSKTGGKFFHTSEPRKIISLYEKVSKLLNYHYYFQYKTPNLKKDGEWRTLILKEINSTVEAKRRYKIDKEEVIIKDSKKTYQLKVKKVKKFKPYAFHKIKILPTHPIQALRIRPAYPINPTPEELEEYKFKLEKVLEYNRTQKEIFKRKLEEYKIKSAKINRENKENKKAADRENKIIEEEYNKQ